MKKHRNRLGGLAKEVILAIGKAGFLITVVASAPAPSLAVLMALGVIVNRQNKLRARRAFDELKKNGLIVYSEKDGKQTLGLTDKGRAYYQKINLDLVRLPKENKWDGVWRIVTFDIPERVKTARQKFSTDLRLLNMYHLEKSIYIYPYECKKEIKTITEFYSIEKFVRYIEAQYIEKDKSAKNFFKLSK